MKMDTNFLIKRLEEHFEFLPTDMQNNKTNVLLAECLEEIVSLQNLLNDANEMWEFYENERH